MSKKTTTFQKIRNREPLNIWDKMALGLILFCIFFSMFLIITLNFILTIILAINHTLLTYLIYDKIKTKIPQKGYERILQMIKESDPFEFEKIVANMYKREGYKIELTPPGRDRGVDVILTKKGIRYVVQVKQYGEGNKISREQLQKLQGACIDYNADGMIFVTHGFYSEPSLEYAKKHGIQTIDHDELIQKIKRSY